MQNWGRVPALNTHPTFIDDLAAMVLEKLPSAAPRPGYMLSANEGINLGPPSGELSGIGFRVLGSWRCMSDVCLSGAAAAAAIPLMGA